MVSISKLRGAWAIATALGALGLTACGSGQPTAQKTTPATCPTVVASTLGRVAHLLYGESVSSDTTRVAQGLVERSVALRDAVRRDDRALAAAAVRRLLDTHHMVRLRVVHNGHVLADVGPARVLSPLAGVLRDDAGQPLGSYAASTQTASAYVSAVKGLTLAPAVINRGTRVLASSLAGAPPAPPDHGSFTFHGQRLANYTFAARGFPRGALTIHVVPSFAYAARVCGATDRVTVHQLITGTLLRIYHFEASSGATFAQVHRVQQSRPLLRAVASHDPAATRRAIVALLNQHIVRLRVSDTSRLLGDVGGPYVLAPVSRDLTVGGATIGHFVLSIQDDLGYLLLSRRLAHVSLVLRIGGRTVMSALRPPPPDLPEQGALTLRSRAYEVSSYTVEAFPSGPLRVYALIPFPYR